MNYLINVYEDVIKLKFSFSFSVWGFFKLVMMIKMERRDIEVELYI